MSKYVKYEDDGNVTLDLSDLTREDGTFDTSGMKLRVKDWIAEGALTPEEKIERFEALGPEETRGQATDSD